MAETVNTAPFSVIATTSEKLSSLVIKNGQLIFIQDKHRIAFDFKDKRTFYNQITELDTDYERGTLSSPSNGYYFVIETAVLWFYNDGWVQITQHPDNVVFIGAELPELGNASEKMLYVNKARKEISVYDKDNNSYLVVANKTEGESGAIDTATEDDINALF